MGLKIDSSLVDMRLSKMEVAIKNIVSLAAIGNLTVNQLMERGAIATITSKAAYMEEPKWTTVMAKNVH
jgi:short-subunit dehydrogenase